MSTYWLSFSDNSRPAGDRHLHVITAADDMDAAVGIACGLGATAPVSGSDIDDCDPVPAAFLGRLLADPDIDAMEAVMAAERARSSSKVPRRQSLEHDSR